MFSNPLVAATIAAVVVIAVVVGSELFRDLASDRLDLTLDQRRREDDARAEQARIEERNFIVDAVATGFDPLGLFH